MSKLGAWLDFCEAMSGIDRKKTSKIMADAELAFVLGLPMSEIELLRTGGAARTMALAKKIALITQVSADKVFEDIETYTPFPEPQHD